MSYLKAKNKFKWMDMQKEWLDEIKSKWKTLDIASYNFMDHDEWTVGDYEQSPLCQLIWGEILSHFLSKKYDQAYTYSINRNVLLVKSDTTCFRFLFDVMNNGKARYNRNKIDEDKNGYEFTYPYHYIGNFTPIPGMVRLPRSLQFIHRDFNEDWNQMLKYLQNHWKEFKMGDLSFDDYIEMTFQSAYFIEHQIKPIYSVEDIQVLILKRGEEIESSFKKILENKNKPF